MSFEPDSFQRLLLLRLAFTDEGGEFLKDLDIKSMVAPRRKALQREGLTEESNRKPADGKRPVTFISLTEKGWAWCNANLRDFCGDVKRPVKIMLPLMSALTRSMADYFQRPEAPASLGEFVQQSLEARAVAERRHRRPTHRRPTRRRPTRRRGRLIGGRRGDRRDGGVFSDRSHGRRRGRNGDRFTPSDPLGLSGLDRGSRERAGASL